MWKIEYTDTFGGDANYSWVRRATMPSKPNETQRSIMRRAKAEMGLTGLKGETCNFGDLLQFHPNGYCTVLFVQWEEDQCANI
jgi:hypothetical protein